MIRYFEKFTTNPFNTTGSKRTPFWRSTRLRGGKQNKTIQNEKGGLPHSIGDLNQTREHRFLECHFSEKVVDRI